MNTIWLVSRVQFDGVVSYRVCATEEKAKIEVAAFKGAFAYYHEYEVLK